MKILCVEPYGMHMIDCPCRVKTGLKVKRPQGPKGFLFFNLRHNPAIFFGSSLTGYQDIERIPGPSLLEDNFSWFKMDLFR